MASAAQPLQLLFEDGRTNPAVVSMASAAQPLQRRPLFSQREQRAKRMVAPISAQDNSAFQLALEESRPTSNFRPILMCTPIDSKVAS